MSVLNRVEITVILRLWWLVLEQGCSQLRELREGRKESEGNVALVLLDM